ncbi:MAG: MoxR family ATPase [Thermodesulfobacteriota bacterium]|nr:MoxR family ATPase [Thermodesulfobacteriota bacterium]
MEDERVFELISDAERRIVDELGKVIVGQRDVIEELLIALFAGGHTLIVGVPGLAKTLMVRSLARILGLQFSRIQFTPDLMPSDIIGTDILEEDPKTGHRVFRFVRGPVFANLILADEINRTPPKTQSALLEAMQEHRVTVSGTTYDLDAPFFVLATQNPIEQEGTYPLPEAQLDRFLIRTTMGYPSESHEVEMVVDRLQRRTDEVTLTPVCDAETFLALQRSVENIHLDERLLAYSVALVRATRSEPQLAVGSSPRGTLALVKMTRAAALLDGREYVSPDDIRSMVVPALAHRVVLSDDAWARRVNPETVVRRAVDRVPVPQVT